MYGIINIIIIFGSLGSDVSDIKARGNYLRNHSPFSN